MQPPSVVKEKATGEYGVQDMMRNGYALVCTHLQHAPRNTCIFKALPCQE